MYEGVIKALRVANYHGVGMEPPSLLEVKHELITNAIDILTKSARKDTSLRLRCSWYVKASMADIWQGDNKECQKIAGRFVEQFADRK